MRTIVRTIMTVLGARQAVEPGAVDGGKRLPRGRSLDGRRHG